MKTKITKSAIEKLHPYYFIIPAVIVYSIFFLVPILINFGTSFTDWNTYQSGANFTGLDNFIKFLKTGDMFRVTKTTFLFTITVVLLQNIFGFFLALALEENTRLNNIFKAIFFAPAVVAIVVWGYLFQVMLRPNGLFNNILSFIFQNDISIAWLGSVNYSIFVVAIVNVWMWTGLSMMIYVAAINSIPKDIIEAAKIDGLGYFGMIKNIIIPLVIPGLTVNILISTIGSLKVFDIVMVLTRGGPGKATSVFNTWIYETYGQGLLGYASAQNIFLIILISAIAFPIYFQLSKRVVEA
jgi:raffinose/stachyose/melibiose transport system permease protein